MGATNLTRAHAAQDHLVETLGDHPEVNGVGIARADGGYVLKVNVRSDGARKSIPAEVDGVDVRVQVVHRIRKRHAA